MKKLINIPAWLLFVLLLTVSSCQDDFLSPKPNNSIADDEAFSSLKNAQAALIGAYDQLSSYTGEGLYIPIMSDLFGEDLMLHPTENYGWFIPVYQYNILSISSYPDAPWWSLYKVVHDANMIVAYASEIPDATDEDRDLLVGQAKVMRAYAWLNLAQMYSPAYAADPDARSILLRTQPVSPEDHGTPRSTLREVYKQIESDLTNAIGLLEYKDRVSDKGFFDKRAAEAILARVYLNMGEWEKARDMAKNAHNERVLYAQELLDGFVASNSETIFSVAYTVDDNNVYFSLPSYYWPTWGYSSMRATKEFVELFHTNDYRSFLFTKDIYWTDPQITLDYFGIIKFQHNGIIGNAEKISIRAAEMYLIEAECEAELGNYKNAQDALYVVQSRSYPGIRKSTSTGQQLIDEILLERRKELFGEGFRWNDIKRRQLRITRETGSEHWAKVDIGPEDSDYYKLTFPIPQTEIDSNPMLTEADQNEGY